MHTGPAVTRMRESTKKQLDLQEILFSRMVVRSEFVLQQHLGHAVQAAAADLEKANITRAEAIALLDYDKREMMPNNSLLYKVDKYDKVSPLENLQLVLGLLLVDPCLYMRVVHLSPKLCFPWKLFPQIVLSWGLLVQSVHCWYYHGLG